jgi:hypothetical protein
MKVLHLDAVGLLVGVSVFPVAIVVAALRMSFGQPDAPAEPTGPASQTP